MGQHAPCKYRFSACGAAGTRDGTRLTLLPAQAPISLRIQLPSHPEKPEWKLDGSVITIPELPVTLLVSTLRDRIISHLGSAVSASKMRISLNDNFLTNANSLAVYNLEDEDLVALILRAK